MSLLSADNLLVYVDNAKLHYENLSLSSACESVLEIGNAGNLYWYEGAPWSLFKQGGASTESAAKSDTRWGGLRAGQVMAEPKAVFARIEIIKEGEYEVPCKAVKSKKKISQGVMGNFLLPVRSCHVYHDVRIHPLLYGQQLSPIAPRTQSPYPVPPHHNCSY